MHIIIRRAPNTCQAPYIFYNCGTNGFAGCCLDPACDLPNGCPDESTQPDSNTDSIRPTPSSEPTSTSDASESTLTTAATTLPPKPFPSSTLSSSPTDLPRTSTTISGLPRTSTTSSGLPPASATSSTTADAGDASPYPRFTTPFIVVLVVGLVAVFVILWLIWHCVVRRKRAEIKETDRLSGSPLNMPQQQHLPSLEQGSQKFGRYEAIRIPIHHDLLKDQPPNSSTSSHSQHPMTHNSSVPSALSSPANHEGFQPTSPALVSELSGQSTPTPELSPNPERLQINRGRPRTSTVVEGVDGILPVPKVSENGRMRPNLEMTGDEHSGGKPSHVTSWMSYGNGAAGPVR